MPSKHFICSLIGHTHWVRCANFNDNSNLVVSCSDDKLVKLWDISTHTLLHNFNDHDE